MKSFKQFLTEYYDDLHVSLYIFDSYAYPLDTKMLQRIFKKLPKVTTFHVTTPWNLSDLIKIEDSKKSISTFTKMERYQLSGGIETSGGIIIEVEGNLLAKGDSDIYSVVDNNGRRWIDVGVVETDSDMLKVIKEIRKKTFEDWTKLDYREDYQWNQLQYIKDRKELGKLIKLYFRNVEKLSKKYFKTIKNFVMGVKRDYFEYTKYNEVVINQFKIKHVYVISDNSNFKEDTLETVTKDAKGRKTSVISSSDIDKIIKKTKNI